MHLGNDVAWHPDGSLVAIALSSSQIKIFDRRAAKLIQLYNVHLEAVNSIAFHPSGNVMITGSDDGSTKVLDLLEGRPIYTLVGHDDAVTAVAFSGDGNDFATASKDKQVRNCTKSDFRQPKSSLEIAHHIYGLFLLLFFI